MQSPDGTPSAKDVSVQTSALAKAVEIMAHLRGPHGCPWDREQTFDSIKRHTLEETYEVFDAIDRRDWTNLKEELGDLLLQVLFYAQMANEAGHFSIADVATTLNEKLVRRHPHIFSTATAATAAEVKRTWEAVKQTEKATLGKEEDKLFLDEVSRHMPALSEAYKLGQRASKVGFDWPDANAVLEKLTEETAELRAEIEGAQVHKSETEEELGDLLFTAVNLARHLQIEPEFALRGANAKFRSRFGHMERISGLEGLQGTDAAELDRLWRQAKLSLPVTAAKVADEWLPHKSSPEST